MAFFVKSTKWYVSFSQKKTKSLLDFKKSVDIQIFFDIINLNNE